MNLREIYYQFSNVQFLYECLYSVTILFMYCKRFTFLLPTSACAILAQVGSLMEDSFNQGLSSMQTPAVLKMLTPSSRMSHLLMSEKKTPASHLHIVTPKVMNTVDR